MYRGSSKYFKVVTEPDGHFAVWFADAPLQCPWAETGRYGTEDECWDYVDSHESTGGFLFYFPAVSL